MMTQTSRRTSGVSQYNNGAVYKDMHMVENKKYLASQQLIERLFAKNTYQQIVLLGQVVQKYIPWSTKHLLWGKVFINYYNMWPPENSSSARIYLCIRH